MDHFERNFWDLPDVAASQYGSGAACYAWPFGDVLGVFSSKDIMDHLLGAPLPTPKRQCVRPVNGLSWSQPRPLYTSYLTPFVETRPSDLDAAPSLTSSPPHEKKTISHSPAPVPPSVSQEFKSALGPITVTFLAPQVTSSPTVPSLPARRRKNAHCHLCDKRFENRYKLKMHLNTHTGARPFTCDVCGKGFMRRTTLNAHRIIHDASQFSCPTCNRTFKRSSERLIHILLKVCLRKQRILRRTVSGWFCDVCNESVPLPEEHQCPVKGRRRQCPVCGMDFGRQRDHKMLTHVRQDHPEFLASL
ncbi:zinc finger protein 628-like [Penaeus chinensis]|uniref:zinc finger protein 628-like n=1 Tax=Penaeus chinensis TaxID=139456 RepID=UPI001FB5E091|nr:zinc finger protein 628-like [Penaeus chinensis]